MSIVIDALKENIIKIKNNSFRIDNNNYFLKNNNPVLLNNSSVGIVIKYDLYCNDSFVKEVVVKIFKFADEHLAEYQTNKMINNMLKINNIAYDNKPLFCDFYNRCIIYNYLGETLDDKFIEKYNLTTIDKLKIFKNIIDNTIILLANKIIHNDIKPANIVMNKLEPKFIDFGIAYIIPKEYNRKIKFNTTINCGSPEYLLINQAIIDNKQFDKEINKIFYYSQYYTLCGIFIGLFTNDMTTWYKTIYKYIDLKYENETCLVKRFSDYTEENINKATNEILDIFVKKINDFPKNHYNFIINLIKGMLNYDYNKRISLNNISFLLSNMINDK